MALPIKISLPEHFLEDEVRCGYEVTSKLKKVWAVQLDLVSELKRVCDKYNLKFMLAYGTLIGAVRHKGFIPWDDDFDVWICRDDFEKLISVGEKEFKHPYFLQHALNDQRYFLPYARLRNSDTTGAISGHTDPSYNNGIYVDIYVLDGYSDSPFLFAFQTLLRNVAEKPCIFYYRQDSYRSRLKNFIYVSLRLVFRLFAYERCFSLYRKTLTLFNKSAMRWGPRYRKHPNAKKWWIEKSVFDNLKDLPYENLMLPCPRNYDEHLVRMYGDYMAFPPVSERGKWHEGIIHFEPEMPFKVYLRK